MRNPRIGLLPLYVQLYDDLMPDRRAGFEPFLKTVSEGLAGLGLEVVMAEVCRTRPEFETAAEAFRNADVDLVVTLHLAYSPSLESVDVLCELRKPICMLDVTMDYDFGQSVSPDRIMYNHGVHGVQDLASMLRRRKYPFEIVAGHVTQSPALERTAGLARAAYAARVLNSVTALRIGPVFKGMGDFQVQDQVMLERLGVRCVEVDLDTLEAAAGAVDEASVTAEIKADLERFAGEVPEDVHRATNRVGLGVRRLLDEHGALAFSVNFLAFDRSEGAACTVPFLEACKAMSRGLGYAGEGDLLTAALIAALNQAFGGTTFTEIFCPDWQGESLFLSHMGEINPDVSAVPAVLMEKPYPFSAARNPAVITAAPRPGPATLVNLAPGPDDTFTLIVAPVEVLEDTEAADLQAAVRGWIQPECEVAQFLENYSRLGGTHHSALMLGYRVEVLRAFAGFTGMGFAVIE